MYQHDRLVLPQHADQKPSKYTRKKQVDVPWGKAEGCRGVAKDLNDRRDPFDSEGGCVCTGHGTLSDEK